MASECLAENYCLEGRRALADSSGLLFLVIVVRLVQKLLLNCPRVPGIAVSRATILPPRAPLSPLSFSSSNSTTIALPRFVYPFELFHSVVTNYTLLYVWSSFIVAHRIATMIFTSARGIESAFKNLSRPSDSLHSSSYFLGEVIRTDYPKRNHRQTLRSIDRLSFLAAFLSLWLRSVLNSLIFHLRLSPILLRLVRLQISRVTDTKTDYLCSIVCVCLRIVFNNKAAWLFDKLERWIIYEPVIWRNLSGTVRRYHHSIYS